MQNTALASHSINLGTVHISVFDMDKVSSILGIPESIALVS
jgi:hypothetical protein